MSLAKFVELLDAYGADPACWPDRDREPAQILLAANADARADLARAAKLDALISSDNAPWVVFMNRQWPKFVSPHLQGLVFNGTYFELFPSMVLTK